MIGIFITYTYFKLVIKPNTLFINSINKSEVSKKARQKPISKKKATNVSETMIEPLKSFEIAASQIRNTLKVYKCIIASRVTV